MERYGRDLETQSDEQQCGAGSHESEIRRPRLNRGCHLAEPGRRGTAKEKGDTEEHKTGSE